MKAIGEGVVKNPLDKVCTIPRAFLSRILLRLADMSHYLALRIAPSVPISWRSRRGVLLLEKAGLSRSAVHLRKYLPDPPIKRVRLPSLDQIEFPFADHVRFEEKSSLLREQVDARSVVPFIPKSPEFHVEGD